MNVNEPDLSFDKDTLELVKNHLKPNQLLVLESTTYPGTTEEEIVPIIEKQGFNIGSELFYWIFTGERRSWQSRIHYTKYTKSCQWTY